MNRVHGQYNIIRRCNVQEQNDYHKYRDDLREDFYLKGNVTDNYVSYSGMTWRIVSFQNGMMLPSVYHGFPYRSRPPSGDEGRGLPVWSDGFPAFYEKLTKFPLPPLSSPSVPVFAAL